MTTATPFARYWIVGEKRSERIHDDAAQWLSVAHANKLAHLAQFAQARLQTDDYRGR